MLSSSSDGSQLVVQSSIVPQERDSFGLGKCDSEVLGVGQTVLDGVFSAGERGDYDLHEGSKEEPSLDDVGQVCADETCVPQWNSL